MIKRGKEVRPVRPILNSMLTKWRFIILCFFAAIAVLTIWVVRPQPGLTLANAYRIRTGMHLKEIECLLGRTADIEFPPQGKAMHWCRVWVANDFQVSADFN